MDVAALVEQAREGRPRAVARLISLVEEASPQLREVMAALAPLTGGAYVVGLTGSPGVGKSTSTSALVTAYRRAGKRVGVLAVDPSSPFSGGALLGDRVRMSGARLRPGRLHPLDGHPRPPRRARLGRAAGDPGAGRGGLRRDPGRDGRRRPVRGRDRRAGRHHRGAARPGHGRRHPGGQGRHPGDRRRLRGQQGRPGRRGRHRPRAEPHARPRRVARPRRLAAADRQDGRRPRRGHRRGRRGAGEAPRVDGGARRARRAPPRRARRTRSRRSRSPRCASGSATCTATSTFPRLRGRSRAGSWTRTRLPTL